MLPFLRYMLLFHSCLPFSSSSVPTESGAREEQKKGAAELLKPKKPTSPNQGMNNPIVLGLAFSLFLPFSSRSPLSLSRLQKASEKKSSPSTPQPTTHQKRRNTIDHGFTAPPTLPSRATAQQQPP